MGEKYAPGVKWDGTPISKHGMTNWKPPVCQTSAVCYHWSIVEAGNEWPIHVAVLVRMAVEESRGRAQRSQGPRREYMCGRELELDLVEVRSTKLNVTVALIALDST
jgi:hypothetical protein